MNRKKYIGYLPPFLIFILLFLGNSDEGFWLIASYFVVLISVVLKGFDLLNNKSSVIFDWHVLYYAFMAVLFLAWGAIEETVFWKCVFLLISVDALYRGYLSMLDDGINAY